MPEAKTKRRLLCTEGRVVLDGRTILDTVKFVAKGTPTVAKSRALGDPGESARWKNLVWTVELTEYRSTPWMREAIKRYLDTGETPQFTIQGINTDKNSDYYDANGADTVTGTGCVITSDIELLGLDTAGETAQNTVTMSVYQMVL